MSVQPGSLRVFVEEMAHKHVVRQRRQALNDSTGNEGLPRADWSSQAKIRMGGTSDPTLKVRILQNPLCCIWESLFHVLPTDAIRLILGDPIEDISGIESS